MTTGSSWGYTLTLSNTNVLYLVLTYKGAVPGLGKFTRDFEEEITLAPRLTICCQCIILVSSWLHNMRKLGEDELFQISR